MRNLSSPMPLAAAATAIKSGLLAASAIMLAVLLPASAASALAGVIFEKPPALNNAFPARPTVILSTVGVGGRQGSQQAVDDFTLVSNQQVTAVRWYGDLFDDQGAFAAAPSQFRVEFFADEGGQPAVNSFFSELIDGVIGVGSGFFDGGREVNEFEAVLGSLVLLPAGQSWFSVRSSDTNDLHWHIAALKPGDPLEPTFFRGGDGEAWFAGATENDGRNELAFALLDGNAEPVPESATLAIIGAGLAGLSWVRRRRG